MVGTRCGFHAAPYALQLFDDVFCFLAFDEHADALGVAVASADKNNGVDGMGLVIHFELYLL